MPLTKDEYDELEAHFRSSEPQQAWNWARCTLEYAQSVQRDGPTFEPAQCGIFWLRLFGVLVDLAKYLAGVGGGGPALAAVEGVRAALTTDELVWTQYRRDSEGHVIVNAYAPLLGDGKPRDGLRIKTLT